MIENKEQMKKYKEAFIYFNDKTALFHSLLLIFYFFNLLMPLSFFTENPNFTLFFIYIGYILISHILIVSIFQKIKKDTYLCDGFFDPLKYNNINLIRNSNARNFFSIIKLVNKKLGIRTFKRNNFVYIQKNGSILPVAVDKHLSIFKLNRYNKIYPRGLVLYSLSEENEDLKLQARNFQIRIIDRKDILSLAKGKSDAE
tara:strand:+ start:5313 stop:5912 length:600 start_codon:yes stop_codon:yes gene_type:complete